MKKDDRKNDLVTKSFLKETLDNRLKGVTDRLVKYINLRLEPIEEAVGQLSSMNKKLDSILNTLDFLAGRYTKLENEHDILSAKYPEINDRLEDHDVRIVKLEQKSTN